MGKKPGPRKGRVTVPGYGGKERGKNISVVASAEEHADINAVSNQTGVSKSNLLLHGYRKLRGMSTIREIDRAVKACEKPKM